MSKTAKKLLLLAALLLAWGLWDLYRYATVGRELLQLYAGVGSVERLVDGQLLRGLLKAVAAAAVALSAWWIGRRGNPGA